MIELKELEMSEVIGGAALTISGTLLNGLYRSLSILVDIGRSLGTSIRMLRSGQMCSL